MLGEAITIFVVLLSTIQSTPYNRITESDVTHPWFEVGFETISDSGWTTITTTNVAWEEDIVVFVSIPSFGGSHFTEGKMIAPRMKQEATKNVDNSYTFQVKLVQANDSFCLRNWSTPSLLGESQVSYMVVEKGVYFIDGHSIVADSGDINRADNDGSATVANGNAVRLNYPVGCDGDVSSSCTITDVASQTELGALQQLQTSVNTIDNGQDLFLSVRTRVVNIRHIQLVMFPHSSSVPSYFELTTPEVVGYLVFAAFQFICSENMVFETAVHEGVTSSPIHVSFFHHFDYVPGMYGTLGTTISLTDATTLRLFNSTSDGSNFITQEDQCDSEQTDHTTAERVFTLVVGEARESNSNFSCNVVFNSAISTPTSSPSSLPSSSPSAVPTVSPTSSPTVTPTLTPTYAETATPTGDCNAAAFEVKFTKTPRT